MPPIRRALPTDAEALTALMHDSSAYRGAYASILDGYAITAAQIARYRIHLAEQDGAIAGFYALITHPEPELDLLFVADSAQGTGLGAALFRHMCAEASRQGIKTVKIVAHPPALGFYQRMGATQISTKPPTQKAPWPRPILTAQIQPHPKE